jgi:dephospho-CoA kinase
MRVVAFTGMPGSGKSDAVEEARRRGIPIVVMGDFVRAEARSRGLSLSDADVGRVAQQMRREHGADVWARKTADAVAQNQRGAKLVVIDGVRSLDEIATLRRRFGTDFQLVAIEAPDEARVRRLMSRGRADDANDAQSVRRRDEREVAWGLKDAMRQADARIVNDGGVKEFQREVARLFDRLTASEAGGSATGARPAASGTGP